jgi:hypothetical protein
MKIRRGVSLEQTTDDIERLLGKISVEESAPNIKNMDVGDAVQAEDGTLYIRTKTGLWKFTGTQVT